MYVIYHPVSTKLLQIYRNGMWQDAKFTTKSAASRVFNRQNDTIKSSFVIEEFAVFLKTQKTVVRHGVGPAEGKIFEVPCNTPWTSGPWSETYWCQ